MREQLVAAGMHARQRRDRLAGIHPRDDPCRGLQGEVDLAAFDSRRHPEIADVGEPFRAQQLLGDLSRREADGSATL